MQRIRVLSYNIQAGIDTRRYRDYVTHSWKHFLPHGGRERNLNRISGLLHNYDLVGLQEVDSGSLRTGFIDQTKYLAKQAGFPHWHKQVNTSYRGCQAGGLFCVALVLQGMSWQSVFCIWLWGNGRACGKLPISVR